MRALLSIIALYKAQPDLFDDLHIPPALNREALIDELCMECGEMNLTITNPQILKIAIDRWSSTRIEVWQHLFDTTQYVYNPIWNKDGVIKETEKMTSKSSMDGTDTDETSAYNSTTYQPNNKTTIDHDTAGEANVERTRIEQGNIGITTTQQMIKEEREIADFSLYRLIIDEFKRRFCIMVY